MVERAEVGKINRLVLHSHVHRYVFASQFTNKKCVLDIASSIGYGSDILEKQSNPSHIIAGDIYLEGLVYGQKKYSKKIQFCNLDVMRLPIRDDFFDIVVSFETIEHLKDPKSFLNEVYRVLKNDGVFLCSTPNRLVTERIGRMQKNPFHEKEFTHEELSKLLLESFRDIKSYGQKEFASTLFYRYPIMWKMWRIVRPLLLQFLKKRKDLNLKNLNPNLKVIDFWPEAPTMIFVAKK